MWMGDGNLYGFEGMTESCLDLTKKCIVETVVISPSQVLEFCPSGAKVMKLCQLNKVAIQHIMLG